MYPTLQASPITARFLWLGNDHLIPWSRSNHLCPWWLQSGDPAERNQGTVDGDDVKSCVGEHGLEMISKSKEMCWLHKDHLANISIDRKRCGVHLPQAETAEREDSTIQGALGGDKVSKTLDWHAAASVLLGFPLSD